MLRRAFPDQAARVLAHAEAFVAVRGGFATSISGDPAAAVARRSGLSATLPARAEEAVRFHLLGGIDLRVSENGASGVGALVDGVVTYPRPGGASFWTTTDEGYEEWLHLKADQVRSQEAVAAWDVDGLSARQADGAVELVGADGTTQLRVTAPIAFASSGRIVLARLEARGSRIELFVDADGEAVLVDPVWSATPSMASGRAAHVAVLLGSSSTSKILVAGGTNGSGSYLTSAELYDPSANTWSAAASMSTGRELATGVLLQNGKVLVAGGYGSSGALASAEIYDPVANTWSAAHAMTNARYGHAAAVLSSSGKVLVVGGHTASSYTASAEVYDPVANTWTATGTMTGVRAYHTATTLAYNGDVLVTGGYTGTGYVATANLYNPSTNTWSAAASMSGIRGNHTAVQLSNNQVLVAGGLGPGLLASAELYNPATNTWSSAGSMSSSRQYHAAVLLANGKVLVTGGITSSALAATELYDPSANAWSSAGSMISARYQHTATTILYNGKVLVTGGVGTSGSSLPNAELYDPYEDSWGSVAPMSVTRHYHTVTTLANGNVLIAGGFTSGGSPLASVDLFNFTTTMGSAASLNTARAGHTATLLQDGTVLVAGGESSSGSGYLATAELYNPSTNSWSMVGQMLAARYFHTATLLQDGTVLVAGGYNDSSTYLASAELYNPSTQSWSSAGSMSNNRYSHQAALLQDGRVLVTGGNYGYSLATAELYSPSTKSWSSAGSMSSSREGHRVTLLPNGRVLVAGGTNGTTFLATTDLYDPVNGWLATAPSMNSARGNFAMSNLGGGRVLVAGGFGTTTYLASAEIYDASSNAWLVAAPLNTAREWDVAPSAVLKTGDVLVTGGFNGSSNLASAEYYYPAIIDDGNPCTADAWNSTLGQVTHTPLANGAACDDGNPCTTSDQCTNLVCAGTTAANGTSCGAGHVCSGTTCLADCYIGGTFYPSGTVNPGNACQVCAPATSTTAWSNQATGTACNDGNPCTTGDQCIRGACAGTTAANGTSCGAGLVCNGTTCASDCYIGGTFYASGAVNPGNACQVCTPATSTTAWSNRANGTACDDGNACTTSDQCTAGTCAGTTVANGTSCGAGLVCSSASCTRACYIGGVFYASGGVNAGNACQVCAPTTTTTAWSNQANGTACNDGNACTQTDTCQSGVCTGSSPVVCNTPPDACHIATGATCNTSTGACTYPAVANGMACNDGNACTQTDTCQSGVCTGSSPVVCNAPSDACHIATGATCNTSTGACTYAAVANGTACNDGNACTRTDTCQSGVCTGSNPVVCTASDQCHVAGTCNTSTGVCPNLTAADGTPCSNGNPVPQTDTCIAGVCTDSCGDGYRDPSLEECDDGAGNGLGACSATCTVTDIVLAPQGPDAGGPQEMTLGDAPHPVAAGTCGFAAGFALGSSPPTELDVSSFDTLGRPIATQVVSTASDLYPSGTGVALAAVGCGKYAAAWTDYGDDGDGAGVALRLVEPGVTVSGPPGHANAGTELDQVLEDMIWTGSELVVAWSDDDDLSSMGALKVRTFDASLSPTSGDQVLAQGSGLSASPSLTPFAGSWAAAWLYLQGSEVEIMVGTGGVTWIAWAIEAGGLVDRPAIVDLDGTHLLVTYAVAASSADLASLEGVIVDTVAGTATPLVLPPAASAPGADARRPSLARVGMRVVLSWVTTASASSAEALPGDLWLKEMDLGATPGTLDTSRAEIPLPRAAADATSSQDAPVLASMLPGAPPTLVSAWQDLSVPGASRVLVEAIPVPTLRKVGQ